MTTAQIPVLIAAAGGVAALTTAQIAALTTDQIRALPI